MVRATRKVGIVVSLSNFMLEAQRRRGGWMPASTVMASTFWEEGSAEIIVLNGRAIFRTHGKAHDLLLLYLRTSVLISSIYH